MIVDVRRCGDATPEDGIGGGGAKGQGRDKRHQGGAEQNKYTHGLSSEIASLCMGPAVHLFALSPNSTSRRMVSGRPAEHQISRHLYEAQNIPYDLAYFKIVPEFPASKCSHRSENPLW